MRELRLLCGAFWLACGWCAGDAVCLHTRQHLAALEQTILLLQRLRQEIGLRHTELGLLFERLAREGLVKGESFGAIRPPAGLTPPEQACFAQCFGALGRTGAVEECQRLLYYQQRFAGLLARAERQARPQLELSRKLGLAAGLAAAILCI